MAALKEDDDLCWCSQLCLVNLDTPNAAKSLSDQNHQSIRGVILPILREVSRSVRSTLRLSTGRQENCPNIFFDENSDICPVRVSNAIGDNISDRTGSSNGISFKWLGYRSKEGNKTPAIGVSAV